MYVKSEQMSKTFLHCVAPDNQCREPYLVLITMINDVAWK